MSKNLDITVNDFENICRTCLSREDLKPLYESMLLSDMLMSFTFVTFTKEDGLPVNICKKCICEINQAYIFAKRCEATDSILRKCIKNRTKFTNNLSQAQIVEPINEVKKEIQIDINSQIIPPNSCRIVEGVLEDYKNGEQNVMIENVYDETYDDSVDQSYRHTMYSETFDNPGPMREPYPGGVYNEAVTHPNNSQRMHTEENFSAKRALAIHNTSNTNEKQHVCSFCNKTFSHFTQLNIHMRIHAPGQLYSCIVCDKSFSKVSSLRRHNRSHIGLKPYNCSICNQTFTQSHHLKIHMRIHRGEKPYTCKVCSKSFTQSNTLKRHENVHQNEWFIQPNV